MNILEGLEKFGLNVSGNMDLYGDEKKNADAQNGKGSAKEPEYSETDFLLEKTVKCTVCDHSFKTRSVKTSKLRRLEPDKDLRPKFQYIDTIKYDVQSCPYCGYTAMTRYFDHLSTLQIKLIRESVGAKFTATSTEVPEIYDYDFAIDRYKLALLNTIVKKGKTSEKAYTCLKLAWLCRGKAEDLIAKGGIEDSESVKKCRAEELAYYAQAYEGLGKAVESEMFPICGMDQNTVDLLMAEMAFKLGKNNEASRFVSRLLLSRNAGSNLKKRAEDLKEELVAKAKKS
jgi:uncharacterized protein (DUF2225 family)